MPANSQRIYGSYRIRISKRIRAPADYAHAWLTDFRARDGRFSSSRPRYRVQKLSPDRVLRIRFSGARGKSRLISVELVRLHARRSWHVDQIDETDLATVDYRVVRLGPRRSRITLDILERWMTPKFPGKAEYVQHTGAFGDRLISGLEARYRSGRLAVG